MKEDLYVTEGGMIECQIIDAQEVVKLQQQNYSEAPLSDLLLMVDIIRRMKARNAKLEPIWKDRADVPF